MFASPSNGDHALIGKKLVNAFVCFFVFVGHVLR
jgi:hypothetical protein